jgi:hypothetical protein
MKKAPPGGAFRIEAGVKRSGPRKSGTSEACLGVWPHSFPSSFLTPQIRRGSHRRSGGATHPSNEGSGQVSTTIVTRPSFTSPTPSHRRHSRATERHSVNPKTGPIRPDHPGDDGGVGCVARAARNRRTGSRIPFSSTTPKSSKTLPEGAPDSATASLIRTSLGRA